MIQLSDLVIYCVRKFFEMDRGYRENWPDEAKKFYADCFARIYERVQTKSVIEQPGPYAANLNELVKQCQLRPKHGWKAEYGIA